MLMTLLMYLGFGAIAGILAGLLGVGGGLIIVPIVSFTLEYGGAFPEHIHHIALGTSFATIIFTSISSFMAHNRLGTVQWPVVYKISPGILLGVGIGGLLAAGLNTKYLQIIFVLFIIFSSVRMFMDINPSPSRALPGTAGILGMGGLIGFLSSLVGIGGGLLTVPFLHWCNVPMRQAIGTSAAVGLPIAVMGTVSYLVSGWGMEHLPAYTLGYIYLPATAGIAAASVITAKIGTALSHKLPVSMLKKIFACLLLTVGARMIWKMF